jgi:hypothetical protein
MSPRVAIVGAGISGLACAGALVNRGFHVTVFDKGRGPGGRASTRRDERHAFDHGAQYFTVRDVRFGRAVNAWQQRGIVSEWRPRLASVDTPGRLTAKLSTDRRYVGVPGMNAVVAGLAESLGGVAEVRFERRVTNITHGPQGWRIVTDQGGPAEAFDAVVVALPAPQGRELLAGCTETADGMARVRMEPCWAAMFAFDQPLPIEADGVFINLVGGPLAWVSRDSSKPGRPAGERWVLHAAPAWSRENIGRDRADIASRLLAAFDAATGIEAPPPVFVDTHLWRYAMGACPRMPGMLFDDRRRLAIAGDWCSGGRIEGAYLSGIAAAGRLLGEVVDAARSQPAETPGPRG